MFTTFVSTAPAYLPMAVTMLALGLAVLGLVRVLREEADERFALVRLGLEYEAPESPLELVNLELESAEFEPVVRRFDMNLEPLGIGLGAPVRRAKDQPTA